MDPQFLSRLRTVVGEACGLVPERLVGPDTTLAEDDGPDSDGWLTLFPVGDHVVAHVPTPLLDAVRSVVPEGRTITAADLAAAWPERDIERELIPLLVLHAPALRPAAPQDGAMVRLLDRSDAAAFESFHARCSPEDREEALVDIDHLAAGVFVGDQLVAVSSVFTWFGFEDIGILTDPDHRRRGHGAAAVSAVCRALAEAGTVGCYRHFPANLASRALALSIGLVPIGDVVRVRPAPLEPTGDPTHQPDERSEVAVRPDPDDEAPQ